MGLFGIGGIQSETGPVSFPVDLEVERCVGTRARARPSHSFPPVFTSSGTQPALHSGPGPAQPLGAMAMRQALAALQRSAAPWATARAACAGSRVVRPCRSPPPRARRPTRRRHRLTSSARRRRRPRAVWVHLGRRLAGGRARGRGRGVRGARVGRVGDDHGRQPPPLQGARRCAAISRPRDLARADEPPISSSSPFSSFVSQSLNTHTPAAAAGLRLGRLALVLQGRHGHRRDPEGGPLPAAARARSRAPALPVTPPLGSPPPSPPPPSALPPPARPPPAARHR